MIPVKLSWRRLVAGVLFCAVASHASAEKEPLSLDARAGGSSLFIAMELNTRAPGEIEVDERFDVMYAHGFVHASAQGAERLKSAFKASRCQYPRGTGVTKLSGMVLEHLAKYHEDWVLMPFDIFFLATQSMIICDES